MIGCQRDEEMATRQDTHYRGSEEQTEVRNTQTSNAFEASASSHGGPRIRGCRRTMRRKCGDSQAKCG
jgi:hypothetical protein